MTAQLSDLFFYNNIHYHIVAFESSFYFDPTDYGIFPISFTNMCRRGYFCEFSWDGHLKIKNLYVTTNGNYPSVNGVNAQPNTKDFFMGLFKVYKNLDIVINYSGLLTIGYNLVDVFYSNTGYQNQFAYKNVIRITFHDGKVVEFYDLSESMLKIRKSIAKPQKYFKESNLVGNEIKKYLSKELKLI